MRTGLKGLLTVFAAIAMAAAAQVPPIARPPMISPPLLRITNPAAQPVRLTAVKVDGRVIGRLARTTVELTFRNPNSRVLEGELQFPLLEGQQVTGFALDFDGKWRAAVPVEKAKGQEVFEDVTRARIDPALLEATQGNNFKLRIYPLPANGERRVSLTISERLPTGSDGAAMFRLAVPASERLEAFDFRLVAPGLAREQLRQMKGLAGAEWRSRQGEAAIELARRDYRPEPLVELALAHAAGSAVTTEERDGRHYFYAEVPGRVTGAALRPKPARLALVWDASGSGAERDHGREFALLDAYFKTLGEVEVRLTLARDRAEEAGIFAIRGGDWSALRTTLDKVAYDGATSLAAFRPAATADAVLLFSDGLGNYGVTGMPKFDAPLLAVSAAPTADIGRLRQAAAASGGAVVDLTRTETGAAVKALRMAMPQLIAMRANGARDMVATAPDPATGRIAVAGVLTEAATEIELEWQLPSGRRERQTLKVTRSSAPAGFAAQEWARLRVAELDAEYELNRAEVQRLGKAFGLVTRGTSLIVLDRVEDYVRYEIVPPLELRADYDRLRGQARLAADKDRAAHLEDIVRRFGEKAKWWDKDFPKADRPRITKNKTVPQPASAGALTTFRAERTTSPVADAAAPSRPRLAAAPAAKPAEAEGQGDAATIRLKPWQPDSPYAERLRRADKATLYRVYLDERPGYLQSTAFFLDAADVFFDRGETELGLRVLSNLAEMNLENRHILRILGYRLLQAKQPTLALPVLERVLALAPHEPQSWRDLGLAYAEDGQWQKAVDHLYQVVIRPWHGRFPDIELIALAEMNALIATAPAKADTAAIEPRLLRNLPLDLRAVLTWDADNTDIDLWVTDPNGEKAFYGNPLTYQGGRMSRDFTGGYGPEEFSLRTAKPGKYLVQAQFYGHRQQVVSGATTLQLKLTTGFGTSRQQDQSVTLRLRSGGEVVTVGEFVIGAKAGQ